AQPVGLVEDARLQLGQLRHRVGVVQLAQELLLGVLVAGGAVAADADAEEAGPAALALRLPDGVEDAAAHALQVAVAALAAEGGRQRVLGAHVLAAAALQDEADIDGVLLVLVPVEDGAAGAEVVAGVAAGDAVHRVLPQVAFRGGPGDGVAADVLQLELVEADGGLD